MRDTACFEVPIEPHFQQRLKGTLMQISDTPFSVVVLSWNSPSQWLVISDFLNFISASVFTAQQECFGILTPFCGEKVPPETNPCFSCPVLRMTVYYFLSSNIWKQLFHISFHWSSCLRWVSSCYYNIMAKSNCQNKLYLLK